MVNACAELGQRWARLALDHTKYLIDVADRVQKLSRLQRHDAGP